MLYISISNHFLLCIYMSFIFHIYTSHVNLFANAKHFKSCNEKLLLLHICGIKKAFHLHAYVNLQLHFSYFFIFTHLLDIICWYISWSWALYIQIFNIYTSAKQLFLHALNLQTCQCRFMICISYLHILGLIFRNFEYLHICYTNISLSLHLHANIDLHLLSYIYIYLYIRFAWHCRCRFYIWFNIFSHIQFNKIWVLVNVIYNVYLFNSVG